MVSVRKSIIFSTVFLSVIGLEIMWSYDHVWHIVLIYCTQLSTIKLYFLAILSQLKSKILVNQSFNLFSSQLISETLSPSINVPFKQSAIQLNQANTRYIFTEMSAFLASHQALLFSLACCYVFSENSQSCYSFQCDPYVLISEVL